MEAKIEALLAQAEKEQQDIQDAKTNSSTNTRSDVEEQEPDGSG